MKDSEKRDFSTQIKEFLTGHKEALATAGFDCAPYLADLETYEIEHNAAEEAQRVAMATMKQSTVKSNETLHKLYSKASSMVEVASALLGKEHEMVQELRKLRRFNTNRRS